MSKMHCWTFKDGRTDPTTVHRFTHKGDPNAVVIHILREQSVDSAHVGPDTVQNVIITAPPDSRCITHLPPNWRNEVWWGPNNEYIGPRGILFVWDDEYADPHAELALAETMRIPPAPVEVVEPQPVVSITPQNAPQPPSKPSATLPSPQPNEPKPEGAHQPTHENSEHLPDGFPGKAKLEAAGVKTFGKLRKRIDAGTLIDIDGIGTETAKAIEEAAK